MMFALRLLVSFLALNIFAVDNFIHDAEFYILERQNRDKWSQEDKAIDEKLATLKAKHGSPPNIIFILWDDTAYGMVGFPGLQQNLGFTTPNINRMGQEGINFNRMYTEPSCTPTRAAFLSGRHPVRHARYGCCRDAARDVRL